MPDFVDIFAGEGGFSEGFLQAEHEGKFYDFLIASDECGRANIGI